MLWYEKVRHVPAKDGGLSAKSVSLKFSESFLNHAVRKLGIHRSEVVDREAKLLQVNFLAGCQSI